MTKGTATPTKKHSALIRTIFLKGKDCLISIITKAPQKGNGFLFKAYIEAEKVIAVNALLAFHTVRIMTFQLVIYTPKEADGGRKEGNLGSREQSQSR